MPDNFGSRNQYKKKIYFLVKVLVKLFNSNK